MSLVLPKQNDFENVPAGSYPAVCYRVLDLGMQFSQFYQKASHKIMISWQLEELMKDGRPFSIHKFYTLSSGKNSMLRKDLESWRGTPFSDADFGSFDLGKLIGVPCMLGISVSVRDAQTRSNVTSIMRLPKGLSSPKLTNETLYFSLNDFRRDLYDKLSDGLKAVIAKSPEYQKIMTGTLADSGLCDAMESVPFSETEDDELPF